jgi:hypothetical protein
MPFVHGKNAKVLVGQYDQSAFYNNADLSWECDTPESTVFGNDDRTYIAGLRNSTLSFAGFWSMTSSNAPDAVAPGQLGAAGVSLISYAPEGLALGKVVYSGQARYTNYSIANPVDGIVGLTLDCQITGKLIRGYSLQNLTAVTSDGNGSAYNLGANTSSGGVAHLHVTNIALPATGQLVVSVQDSATSTPGSWSDLINFTTITCSVATSERKTVAGNIDQYTRAEWAFTAVTTGNATFHVSFSPTPSTSYVGPST